MELEIRGGNNQFGNFNKQVAGSTVFKNCRVSIEIVNCTECGQHQNQMLVESGTQPRSQVEGPATQAQNKGIKMRRPKKTFFQNLVTPFKATPRSDSVNILDSDGALSEPWEKVSLSSTLINGSHVLHVESVSNLDPDGEVDDPVKAASFGSTGNKGTLTFSVDESKQFTFSAAVADTVTIVDTSGRMVKPGDAIIIVGITYIYIGDGYGVLWQKKSTVQKVKLDLTPPVKTLKPINGNVKLFPPEQRVDRALQGLGWQCPVNDWLPLDFICWTFTGLSLKEIHEGRK